MKREELKLEAIKKAYGEYWDKVKDYVDENGWVIRFRFNPFSGDTEIDRTKELYIEGFFEYKTYFNGNEISVRPKSLSGIENNRGWIRIEEYGSNLPDQKGDYWFYTIHKKIVTNYYDPHWKISNKEKYINTYSHYQKIVKPLPPLY